MRLFDVLPPLQPLLPKTEEISKNPNFINFQLAGLIILALFTCFCICANLITFILLILCRPLQRSSRTTNLYVISLCLADLGVGGVVMPLMLCYEWGWVTISELKSELNKNKKSELEPEEDRINL